MKNKFLWAGAILIIVIGSVVRLVGLDKSPPSLGFDEAALGYNAYSLMKTGRDEYGNFLPVSLRSFNDFKPALYAYLTVPFIKLWGLNDVSVRMVSAISGIVSLVFLFLLLRKFLENKYYLLVTFLVLSFEPWRLHFSRNAFETHLSSMFFLIGSYCLLALKGKGRFWALLFLILSAYSYHSARLGAPLLLVFWAIDPIKLLDGRNLLINLRKSLLKNWRKFSLLLLFMIGCVPIFTANSGSLVLTRFKQENVFNRFYPYAPRELLNPLSSLYFFGGIVSGHVFSHISPINLNNRIYDWVKMSPQFIPEMGMLGWVEGIIFVFGLWYLIKNIMKLEKYRFLIYWIVAGIAPAAATWTWFHPLRSLNIYPAMEIIVALGGWQIVSCINSKLKIIPLRGRANSKLLLGILVSMILGVTIIFTINNELLYSAYENHGEYQPGGYKEGMGYLKSIQDNYDQIIIDTPHAQGFIFLFFYQAINPAYIQSFASIRPKPGIEGNLTFDFGKFVFRKVDWPKDKNLKKTVFWAPNSISRSEVEAVPGARIRMIVPNVLYDTADIITIE